MEGSYTDGQDKDPACGDLGATESSDMGDAPEAWGVGGLGCGDTDHGSQLSQ